MVNQSDIKRFLESLHTEQLDNAYDRRLVQVKLEHKEFVELIQKNICPICKAGMRYVNHKKPCFHWLLRPKGVDKKNIIMLLENSDLGFYRVRSYLRWLANIEKPLKNINDLLTEKDRAKVIEETIVYNNIEWTFSCSISDLKGHQGRRNNKPHYHMQIKIDGRYFLTYSDAHIPFNGQDLWMMEAEKTGKFKQVDLYGSGIQELLDKVKPKDILDTVTVTSNPLEATIRIDSLFESTDDNQITGDQLNKAFAESKKTGVPIAKIMQRFGHRGQIFVSPGDGIPEMPHRKKRKR